MKRVSYIIPHFLLIFTAMYITFYIIDIFNSMMNFINNYLTHGILMIFSLLTVVEAVLFIVMILQKKGAKWLVALPAALAVSALGILAILLANTLDDNPHKLLTLDPAQTAVLVFMIIVSAVSVFLIMMQRVMMANEYEKYIKTQNEK